MAGTGDEDPVPLRIGGWLPPTGRRPVRPEDAAATALLPVVPASDPEPSGSAPVRGQAARRRRGPSRGGRWRVTALVAVATVAAAVGVPVLLDRGLAGSGPDRQVQPAPPAVTGPTDPQQPQATSPVPGVSDGGSRTPAASRSATRTTSATPSGAPAVAPGTDGGTGAPLAAPQPPAPNQPAQLPPPAAFTVSVEAEGPAAERRGRTGVRSRGGASGGSVVTGIGDGSGNTVRFSRITVPTAGRYTLTLYYASGERRSGTVTVNGRQTEVSFADTGSDSDPVAAVSVTLSLRAGANTVEFGNRRSRTADLDRIVVSASAG
ncbi:hypothetical protein OG792_10310 [Micromonospora sp. NBC_01699]|uniref:hypothetical protein n=1 Tax=Micromonospora sp. NBC_01699 TaxID=2975984 RepID=UPI002E354AB0|nr:hypothetical protein [Micromonospora sp. NBC_01699]